MVDFKGVEGKSIRITVFKDVTSIPSKLSNAEIKACTEGKDEREREREREREYQTCIYIYINLKELKKNLC